MDENEISQTTDLLKKLEPGFQPYPIFEQIARLIALPVVELIPLRLHDGAVQVLLIQRAPDDPYWPNLWHTPGTIVRATDLPNGQGTNWPAFERLFHDELKGTKVGDPQFVGSLLHKSKRGVEQAQIYWVEVKDEPPVGTFYPIDSLPLSVIESQKAFIQEAARNFQAYNDPVSS